MPTSPIREHRHSPNMTVVGSIWSNPSGRSVTLCPLCRNEGHRTPIFHTQALTYNIKCSICGTPLAQEAP